MAAVPVHEQARAGMANIVRTIANDARIGRLLFSTQLANSVIVRKRAESTALFAMLSGQHAGDTLRMPANDRMKAGAHFAVGGVGQTLSAWLAGDVRLEPDQLVDQLASLLDELTDPKPVRDPHGNSGSCHSRIPGSSSHKRIIVSRMMRCAPVIMKIASGTSITQRRDHRQPEVVGSGGHQVEPRVADQQHPGGERRKHQQLAAQVARIRPLPP